MTDEEGREVHDDEVDQVCTDMATVLGQHEVRQPEQGRPDASGRRTGEAIAESRVADGDYEQGNRHASGEGSGALGQGEVDGEVQAGKQQHHRLHDPEARLAKRRL
jgi:hypothetical protein